MTIEEQMEEMHQDSEIYSVVKIDDEYQVVIYSAANKPRFSRTVAEHFKKLLQERENV